MSERTKKYPDFQNRWRITGRLRVTSRLHIGSGLADKTRLVPVDGVKPAVEAVCRNAAGLPYLPASTLKGALRARMEQTDRDTAARLFGTCDASGLLCFWDAAMETPAKPRTSPPFWPPFWKDGTAVAVSVSIDRETRTAEEHHLFHVEYVPEGAIFSVEITGQNVPKEDVAALLSVLAGFNALSASLTLGAHQVHGWGRLQWENEDVRICEPEHVLSWWQNPVTTGYGVATHAAVGLKPVPAAPPIGRMLAIPLKLTFTSPLLVRDPEQKDRAARVKNANKANRANAKKEPDSRPYVSASNQPIIPGRAVRGVLRSRAEMILRTLGRDVPQASSLPVVRKHEDVRALDLCARIFGASGWRSPLAVSEFTTTSAWEGLPQEFIAIDRFTGGGATGLKFDSVAAIGQSGGSLSFCGTLTLDLSRLETVADVREAKALLALVLRDLIEGDLAFGSGSSKGYGRCGATLLEDGVPLDSAAPLDFATWVETHEVRAGLQQLRSHV